MAEHVILWKCSIVPLFVVVTLMVVTRKRCCSFVVCHNTSLFNQSYCPHMYPTCFGRYLDHPQARSM